MNKFLKLATATAVTLGALTLVACPSNKPANKEGTNTVVSAELKNTFWHNGDFFLLGADKKPTATKLTLPSGADKLFSFIGNEGDSAFVIFPGNTNIQAQEGGALALALGKTLGTKFSGKFYDLSKLNPETSAEIGGQDVLFPASGAINFDFSFAKSQTNYSKKIDVSFAYQSLNFKGEANRFEETALKTSKLKTKGQSYSCVIHSDGKNIAGSAEVQENGKTIKHTFNSGNLSNDCTFHFSFEETYKAANKPTQYKVTGGIGGCNSPALNAGNYQSWLTAQDFKGIGLAYNADKLIAYTASANRDRAAILVCK